MTLPWRRSFFRAQQVRSPRISGRRRAGAPAVLIVQGNDEVKELNAFLEEMALAQRLSVLDVDPPGWGESWLSGARCRGVEDYQAAIRAAGRLSLRSPGGRPRAHRGARRQPGGPSCSLRGCTRPAHRRSRRARRPLVETGALEVDPRAAHQRCRESAGFFTRVTTIDELVRWWRGMRIEESLSTLERPCSWYTGRTTRSCRPDCLLDNAALIWARSVSVSSPGATTCARDPSRRTSDRGMFSWLKETLLAGPTL